MTGKKEITVITTHINADFDALASMLAAQKLYPDALVVFPGSQEKNLRNFFVKSMVYLFNIADIKNIDFSCIKKLVLVDTRQPGRIGKFALLLKRPDLEIHIFDHHPKMANDIKGDYEVIRQAGSTVTILAGIIKEKKIDVSPDEATIMCLGIYEDTGSFTYASTTEEDFMAAAFLLSNGADLNIVSDMLAKEISPKQVELLNDMIHASIRHNINGVEVVVTSVTSDAYVPEFASLVHKMVQMENLDAIFALARMENKIYVTTRSRIPEVDAGAIMASLGGGGHPCAASATIREETLPQIEQRLVNILYKKIRPRRQARHLMSSPPITVAGNISCKEANSLLTRYNVNALLVTEKVAEKERLAGFISRQVVEKALYHELDHVPVIEYTTTEIATVGPDSDLFEIQSKIIENKQRILPVLEKDKIVGVVTRTDLLNTLARQSRRAAGNAHDPCHDPYREAVPARTRNIVNLMKERLSQRIFDTLKAIGKTADEAGCSAYVVGGFVRDMFLYRANEDIDIVIEGDGIGFARKYAKTAGARIHAHEKFGTAVIIFPDGFKIDVASARMEYYKFPAALPTVEMSSIKLDLFRRDFTVNTLVVQLNSDRFGTLIDFFLAQKDIKGKVIRVLHNLSFVEDPTRIFRAIRFEQRFGFSIGKFTSGLIENAVKMDFFKRLSGRRVFTELRLILQEENPVAPVLRLNGYGLLKIVHPTIQLDNNLVSLFNSVKKTLSWYDLLFMEESYIKWTVYFMALVKDCDRGTSEKICARFELAPRHSKIFCVERFKADGCLLWLEHNMPVLNSGIYEKLDPFKIELVLYMMASTKNKEVKRAISYYITHLKYIHTLTRGRDLKDMGFEPGPLYREILQAVLYEKLNGKVETKKEELTFIKNYKP